VNWIALAAAVEAATGIILIVAPSLVIRLILGAGLSEPGQALGRLAGIALLALALACWPLRSPAVSPSAAVRALLVYNLLVTVYLLYLGLEGRLVGPLLWPVVALHSTLTVLTLRVWLIRGAK
jgi:hypothetical protein